MNMEALRLEHRVLEVKNEKKMDLSGAKRYNPNLLDELEKFATEEIKQPGSEGYDLEANLALLRIYVTQPETVKMWLLGQILVKAMVQLPNSDFATLLHLIPEKMQEEQPIASLVALMQHLEGARFSTFWAAADNCRETLSKVPGFAESIRAYILRQVNNTCQQIRQQVLGEFLNLEGSSLDQLVSEKVEAEGWSRSSTDSSIIILPSLNVNVSKESASSSSAFRFEKLAPLLVRG